MANTILPEATYKVIGVGPSKLTSFQGDKGPVEFNVTSVQLEGHQDIWVEVNSATDKPKPGVGDELEGHVEQDDAGKYLPKFKKSRKGGGNWGGGGGGNASPGAIWSARVDTAANIVMWYYGASGKKPADLDEVMARISQTADLVNQIIDTKVGADALTKPAASAPATNSEAGETAAPAGKTVEIEDIKDEELGKLGKW